MWKQPPQRKLHAPEDTTTNLLLGLFFIGLIGSAYAHDVTRKMTVHDKPVRGIPKEADCHYKWTGSSKGQGCQLDDGYYYLKTQYQSITSFNEASSNLTHPGLVSTETFNRELLKHNIGARVPESSFFKQDHADGSDLYIGTKAIPNLQHSGIIKFILDILPGAISNKDITTLAIASTLFRDMNLGNWGYDKEGLIFIDVDNIDRWLDPPKSLSEYIQIAKSGIHIYSFGLSLNNLKAMHARYMHMRDKPLPKFHDEVFLTRELYEQVLSTYIKTCKDTLEYFSANYPDLDPDTRTTKINKHFASILDTGEKTYLARVINYFKYVIWGETNTPKNALR